jgi:hypothetical protein
MKSREFLSRSKSCPQANDQSYNAEEFNTVETFDTLQEIEATDTFRTVESGDHDDNVPPIITNIQ